LTTFHIRKLKTRPPHLNNVAALPMKKKSDAAFRIVEHTTHQPNRLL